MDATFIVAVSIFLVFTSLVLVSSINYFTRTPESATVIEFRNKVNNLFDIFFGSGGISTDERATVDLHRIPLVLDELNGTARTNAVVSVSLDFDDLCDKIVSWNNTLRVYDQQFAELPSKISYQEFCKSQWLNTSFVTFYVNMSTNEKKRVYVYSINNSNTTAPNHNATLTIKGYWKFDETSGTVAKDSSGYQNNGTLFNGTDRCANGNCPVWTTGVYGNAVQLDGSNDYVNISDSSTVNLTSERITLAAWVRLNGTAGSDTTEKIISKTAGAGSEQYELLYTTDSFSGVPNRFRFDLRTSNGLVILYTNETFTSTSAWYHVAGVYNSSHMIVYVDGREKNATTQSSIITGRASDVSIGRTATGGQYFNGTIDEVRIYNATLTASQISSLALTSNQTLDVKSFPAETIVGISAAKIQELAGKGYQDLKSRLGGDFDFRIEIREKK